MRLDELCHEIVDCEHKTAPISVGGGYFAVGTPAMVGNVISFSAAREISEKTFEAWTKRLRPQAGDLLLAREAPVGPVVVIPESLNVAPGQRTVLLRPNPELVHSLYLFYVLVSPRTQRRITDLSLGSTVAHLNVADVRSLELMLPPLREQQAIAEVLGALDDKIAVNAKIAETADELVRAMFSSLDNQGTIPLGSLCASIRDQVTPMRGVPYVGLEHVPRRHMWLSGYGDAGSVASAKVQFNPGDVLFGKLRPYFHKVVSAPVSGVASTDILVLRALDSSLAGFLLAAASSDAVVAACSAASAGTRMPRTKWADVSSCEIAWPGAAAASEMSRSVDALKEVVNALIRESRTLAELRDTLLPALMDGTIRVKDAVAAAEEVL